MDAMDKITKWMTDNQDRMIEVMNKLVDKIPSIADSLMTIAENLPMLIKAVIALKAAELAAKGGRGILGLWNMLGLGAGAAAVTGGAAAVPAAGTAAAASATAYTSWAIGIKSMFTRAGGNMGIGTAATMAYEEVHKSPEQRRAEREAGWWETTKAAAGLRAPIQPKLVSGVDNTNMGKSIGIKIFSTIPNVQAEVVSPGFSPSSLTLPNSGAF
jgi:hypothetical protein